MSNHRNNSLFILRSSFCQIFMSFRHNCLIGISLVQLWKITKDDGFKNAVNVLANSLFKLNFDEKTNCMNARTHTPYPSWNHQTGIRMIKQSSSHLSKARRDE